LWACRRSCAIDGLFGLGKSKTRYSRLESKRLGPKCGALICLSYSHQCQKKHTSASWPFNWADSLKSGIAIYRGKVMYVDRGGRAG
jgi:hypothetical protein